MRFFRQQGPESLRSRGRAPVRWTPLEILGLIVSFILIAPSLLTLLYTFLFPTTVPASPSGPIDPEDRLTSTPGPSPTPSETLTPSLTPTTGSYPPPDTPTPTESCTNPGVYPFSALQYPEPPTCTPTVPTDTPSPTAPTNTPVNTTPTDTPVTTPPTDTPVTTPPTDTPTVPASALRLSKIPTTDQAGPGQEYAYIISVTHADSAFHVVTVSDSLPGTIFNIVNVTATNGSCNVSGTSFSCTVTVNSEQSATITVQVQVRSDITSETVVSNIAQASDNGQTINSNEALVQITAFTPTPTAILPTATFTPLPPTATFTPGPSTATATSAPTATPQPTSPPAPPTAAPPTAAPPPPQPTATSQPEPPAPTNPPQPGATQPPPTPAPPGATAAPTSRPRATATFAPPTATPRRGGGTGGQGGSQPAPVSTATPTEIASPIVPTTAPDTLQFLLRSDWGSVFAGDEVIYTILVVNPDVSSEDTLRDLVVSDLLPANMEVLDVTADNVTVQRQATQVTVQRTQLAPGETLTIHIRTRVKKDVEPGTLLVNQALLLYGGLSEPRYSNVVTVLVVGQAQAQQDQPTAAPTATPPAATPNSTTATSSIVVTPETGGVVANPTATGAAPQVQPDLGSRNPDTSTGAPVLGLMLLGLTLFVHSIRVHRARSRI